MFCFTSLGVFRLILQEMLKELHFHVTIMLSPSTHPLLFLVILFLQGLFNPAELEPVLYKHALGKRTILSRVSYCSFYCYHFFFKPNTSASGATKVFILYSCFIFNFFSSFYIFIALFSTSVCSLATDIIWLLIRSSFVIHT